jgi:hypothetical protein
MFQMLEGICSLVYRWREAKGTDGWSKRVLDLPGQQQKVLEVWISNFGWITLKDLAE